MPLICIKRIEKQKQGYKRFTLMVKAFSFMNISRKLYVKRWKKWIKSNKI